MKVEVSMMSENLLDQTKGKKGNEGRKKERGGRKEGGRGREEQRKEDREGRMVWGKYLKPKSCVSVCQEGSQAHQRSSHNNKLQEHRRGRKTVARKQPEAASTQQLRVAGHIFALLLSLTLHTLTLLLKSLDLLALILC